MSILLEWPGDGELINN